jgi:ActR/RegA family two-component response regulator
MEEMKLMLVDDEERFLSTTAKLLARKGFKVFTALSGSEALDHLNNTIFMWLFWMSKCPAWMESPF